MASIHTHMFKNEAAFLHLGARHIRMGLLVKSMSALVLLLFGTYIVLTGHTIYNIVDKKNVERDIIETRSEIANLENNLFSYYNNVNQETLAEYGFVEYANPLFTSSNQTLVVNQ